LNATILQQFDGRHRHFREMLGRQLDALAAHVPDAAVVSADRRLLIGAYFTHEFAVEAAALFNPSIVAAPDQSGVANGALRFVMSLRAVGEGHLSSIEFRSGVLDTGAGITIDAPGTKLVGGRRTPPACFGPPPAVRFETVKIIRMLASSNYVTTFPADSTLAERVIFPAGPNECAAWRMRASCGSRQTTDDFVRFTISTLNGGVAQNKGMALFPRPIDGKYMVLSRKDRENLHLAASSDVRHWNDVVELFRPQHAWELLQIGNCGSPIETDAGWLVLTHGVGPMRRYAIGALLLDLADPRRVIGHLPEPIIEPDEDEREGYVPNVVYTCGAIVHGERLIVPYGFSDAGIAVAQVPLDDLLAALVASGKGLAGRSH
jgi:hypothetical protein